MLVVGNFFSDEDESQSFDKYKNGEKEVPFPTYILGPNSQTQSDFYEKYEINETNNEICPNLFFLGKRGIYTLASGFTIAYLSGVELKEEVGSSKQSWQYDKKDIIALRNACWKNFSNIDDYRGIDFLLTSQWPSSILEKDDENSSKLISFLALNIKPRYHFCSLKNKHFEKAPFRLPALNARSIEPVSRFVALAQVNNPEKSKFLYAINIQPIANMRLTELMQKSTDEIECPYLALDYSNDIKESLDTPQQFFWNHNDGNQDGRKRGHNDHQRKRFKPAIEAGEQCWFCLQSAELEKHLIICVGEHFYIALAKGPVNNFHALLIPIEHIQSASHLNEDQFQELEIFKRSLRMFYDSMDQVAVFFERNYMSSHANINAIGIPRDMEWQLPETLKDKADEFSLQFETIPKIISANDLPRGAYFTVELPFETFITRTMNKFPINFGRDFVCAETILNAEDRIDWRNCKVTKSIECDIVSGFKDKYKEFDFTRNDDDEDGNV